MLVYFNKKKLNLFFHGYTISIYMTHLKNEYFSKKIQVSHMDVKKLEVLDHL